MTAAPPAVHLRLAVPADAEPIREIYAPIVTATAISFELEVPSVPEMARRIAERMPAHPWLVASVEDGGVVGYAYAGRFSGRPAYEWSVETSLYTTPNLRRRGIGRGLYTSLFAILGLQGYRQAMAGIALPNEASVALHESVGFSLVGVYRSVGWKLGAWHDVGWWQRAIGGAGESPAPERIRSVTELGAESLSAAVAAGEALITA